jgi:hypothetical protein
MSSGNSSPLRRGKTAQFMVRFFYGFMYKTAKPTELTKPQWVYLPKTPLNVYRESIQKGFPFGMAS